MKAPNRKMPGNGGEPFVRTAFLALFLAVSGVGIVMFADFLWRSGIYGLKYALLVLHSILFCLISFIFCTAFFGFIAERRGRKNGGGQAVSAMDVPPSQDPALTAVVVPIYNEEVAPVFARVEAIYRSLRRTGRENSFEFFVLSDSNEPGRWIEEEIAYFHVMRRLRAVGRLHYRRRADNAEMKAGNLSDFLEKWGGLYRYMIVLDADSLLSGEAMVELVRRMESQPHVGIIQSLPGIISSETLFARQQQFANRMYGRLFLAGMDAWWRDSANYIGHNAIIRVQPFMANCRLPRLPWREPMGGQIFSHDFVEAALMRRGGYAVQWACDVKGSYEEGPPDLLSSARRHRRWCQGNLQHIWLLFSRELPLINRCHFLLGILAYTSSLIWLCFLVVSTLVVIQFERSDLSLIPVSGFVPFLSIPLPIHGAIVFCFSLLLLFSPKYFSFFDILFNKDRRRRFGGGSRTAAGVLLESFLSILQAPILMLWHAIFVITIPLGKGVVWAPQKRSNEGATAWRDAARAHGWQTAVGAVWAAMAATLANPTFALWMSPVLGPLIFSIPLNVLLASPAVGRRLRRAGILLTPEEKKPPREMIEMEEAAKRLERTLDQTRGNAAALVLVDPYVNALHVTLQRQLDGSRGDSKKTEAAPSGQTESLVKRGLKGMDRRKFLEILGDADACRRAHLDIWRAPDSDLAPEWADALDSYSPSRRMDLFTESPAVETS